MPLQSSIAAVRPHDHVPEHDRIIADPQGLAAGGGHILDDHLAGLDIRKLFDVGCVLVARIEVPQDGGISMAAASSNSVVAKAI